MENLRSTAQARNTKTYNDNYKKTVTFENEKCTCRVSTDAQVERENVEEIVTLGSKRSTRTEEAISDKYKVQRSQTN